MGEHERISKNRATSLAVVFTCFVDCEDNPRIKVVVSASKKMSVEARIVFASSMMLTDGLPSGGLTGWIEGGDGSEVGATAFVEEGFGFEDGFFDDRFFSLRLDLLNTTSRNTGLVSADKQLQQRIGRRIVQNPSEHPRVLSASQE